MLKEYEETLPGAAERIFEMAETEASHRHRQQDFELRSDANLEARGQIFGFVLGAVALIGGVILIALDKTILGTAAVIGAVAGLSGLFVWARGRGRDLAPPKRREK